MYLDRTLAQWIGTTKAEVKNWHNSLPGESNEQQDRHETFNTICNHFTCLSHHTRSAIDYDDSRQQQIPGTFSANKKSKFNKYRKAIIQYTIATGKA